MMRAYCYPSGLIDFGNTIPKGAKIIARGPEKELREFIAVKARLTRHARHPDAFLVPGVPEADSAINAQAALERWTKWIAVAPPAGVRVLAL